MSPYEQMAAAYRPVRHGWTFEAYVKWYARKAYVFSTPQYFVMGAPCHSDKLQSCSDREKALDPSRRDGAPNCWYIHAMAGDLAAVWKALPFDLPWMAYDRLLRRTGRKELRFLPLAALRRRCTHCDAMISFNQS